MDTVNCTQCGASVERKPYHAKMTAHPFCGFKCYGLWQRTNRVGVGRVRVSIACHTCGTTMSRTPSTVANHNFCSRKCLKVWRASSDWSGANNPTWRGGNKGYRGENWPAQRAKARKRDGHRCQHCGVQRQSLPVHHMRPFCLFDHYREANVIENLITLCPPCHCKADALFWKQNPDLLPGLRFPDCAPQRECRVCGETFQPRSGATQLCDPCCTATCQTCGGIFYSRKAAERTIRYCSRYCSHKRPRVKSSPKT